MRARDRARIEAHLRRMLGPRNSARVSVVWARALPGGAHAAAEWWSRSEVWILISEALAGDPAAIADTLAHEAAHVLTWVRYGVNGEVQDHGPEWRRVYRRLRRVP